MLHYREIIYLRGSTLNEQDGGTSLFAPTELVSTNADTPLFMVNVNYNFTLLLAPIKV